MTDLVVRRLLIDMETPIPRHWCAGDAFRTAFFNALSMSFPVGEQSFIDAVRNGLQALPGQERERLRAEAQAFIGQEATHRRLHDLYNRHLEQQGQVNAWAMRAQRRLHALEGLDPRHALAITAAFEHFTAILANWILRNPDLMGSQDPRLVTLWLWHSAEESEHKATAFDLYRALGGNHEWRITWFRRVTTMFLGDLVRQTVNNLWHDRTFWRWRTWKGAASFLFGRRGVVRTTWRPWREYLRGDFHPSQQDASLSQRWLAEHSDQYTRVGAPA